jgi:hypothetical protein
MPGGIVTIIATVIAGYFAGIQSKRCLWISILALHAVLGSALMCFLPMKMKVGHLIGIYFVNAVGSLPTECIGCAIMSFHAIDHSCSESDIFLGRG